MIQENNSKTFQNWLKATLPQKDFNSKGQSYTQHDTKILNMIPEKTKKLSRTGGKPHCLPQIDWNSKGQSYIQLDTRKLYQNVPYFAEGHTVYLRYTAIVKDDLILNMIPEDTSKRF